jgi:integrase/recombinase XerD
MGRQKTILWDEREARRARSVTAIILAYIEARKVQHATPVSLRTIKRELWTFMTWLRDRSVHDLAVITLAHVEAYQRYLFYYRKKNGEPLAIRTQQHRLAQVRGLFVWATKKHLVPANPAADLVMPRGVQRVPDYLTRDEIAAVMAQPDKTTAVGIRDRAILAVLYSTGMRRFELCNLGVGDWDRSGGLILIRQGKGRKDRLVPIGAATAALLATYVDEARPLLLAGADDHLGGPEGHATVGALFLSQLRLGALVPDAVTALVRSYVIAAGVTKRGSCHLFRHSAATHLLEAGCDVRVIQELLGHAQLDTTAGYTRVAITHLQKAHALYHPAEQAAVAAEG